MKTINDLKQEFADHIGSLDKTSMSLFELSAYADLLRKTDELFRPSYAETMASGIMAPFGAILGKKEEK